MITHMLTPKLKEHEGRIFKEAPDFNRMNSRGELKDSEDGGKHKSTEDIDKDHKEQKEKEKKREKNKAPSTKELRDYKRKLILIHAKDVELNFPSAYPVLGLKEDDTEGKSSKNPFNSKENEQKPKRKKTKDTNPRPTKRRKQ